jgi:hypothetical protein
LRIADRPDREGEDQAPGILGLQRVHDLPSGLQPLTHVDRAAEDDRARLVELAGVIGVERDRVVTPIA